MVNINSGLSGNQVQLESLDSLRSNTNNSNGLQSLESIQVVTNNSGLQSLDSIKANNYSDPNLSIPANDILAPIEALNPELPESNREDTRERHMSGFIGGVFKGFGRAGIDTLTGVVTLAKVVGGGIAHPRQTLSWVGGGIKFAVNHPVKAVKTVAFDLPIGIVRGITQPYKEAIKQGKYGEAVGRGVFDVGLILLTAGIGEEAGGAGKTGTTVEAVEKGSKGAGAVEKGTKVARGMTEGTSVVTTGVEGGVRIAKDAIKVSNVKGNVIINIGTATSNVTATAGKVSRGAKTAIGATEAVLATTESAAGAGRIALGIGDLGKTIAKGASKLRNILSPIGTGIGSEISTGLSSIVGESAASVIKNTTSAIGTGISKTGSVIKTGAKIVKQHPLASALIAGKTVHIIDKGLKASDHYTPGN